METIPVNGNVREIAAAAMRSTSASNDRAERERTEPKPKRYRRKRKNMDPPGSPGQRCRTRLRDESRQQPPQPAEAAPGPEERTNPEGPEPGTGRGTHGKLDQAQENGLITEEELGAALLLDVIARANTTDRQTVYAAVEISITVNDDDIIRAQERAQTISTATGAPTEAVVIGANTGERAAAMIADGKAQMVRYPAG